MSGAPGPGRANPAPEAGLVRPRPVLPPGARERLARALVLLAALGYAIALSVVTIARFRAYRAGLFDLGAFEQTFWNTIHGRPFRNTIDRVAPNYLGNHFSPALVLMMVPYAVVQRTETILVTQSVLLGFAALPIYLLARDWTRSAGAALALSVAYLFSPAVHGANVFDVHETAMLPLLASCTLLFLRRNPGGRAFWASFALLLLAKDEMVLFGVGLALYVALAQRRLRLAAAIGGVAILWGALVFGVLMPRVGNPHEQAVRFHQRYGHLGDSMTEVARAFVSKPGRVWETLTEPGKLTYYHRLLLPVAYLPLLGGWLLLVALPLALVNALTRYPPQYDVGVHYNAVLGALAVLLAARAVAMLPHARVGRAWRALAVAAVLTCAMVGSSSFGLLSGKGAFDTRRFRRDGYAEAADRILSKVPDGAALSADNLLGSHLARRPFIVEFPALPGAEYVLVNTANERIVRSRGTNAQYLEVVRHVGANPRFELVAEDGGILLFRDRTVPPREPPSSGGRAGFAATVAACAALAAAWVRWGAAKGAAVTGRASSGGAACSGRGTSASSTAS